MFSFSRNYTFSLIVSILLAGLSIYAYVRPTYFYIGMSNPDGLKHLRVLLNDEEIFSDEIYYKPFGYRKIEKRMGFRGCELKIFVGPDSCYYETEVSILLKRHVIVEYIEERITYDNCFMNVESTLWEYYFE
ncbi:MAG: hypothetical protein AAFY36_19030 [Bacteroidota bacterium]